MNLDLSPLWVLYHYLFRISQAFFINPIQESILDFFVSLHSSVQRGYGGVAYLLATPEVHGPLVVLTAGTAAGLGEEYRWKKTKN